MAKQKTLKVKDLLEKLHAIEYELSEVSDVAQSPNGEITGPSGELEEAQRLATRLTRDLSDIAVRLYVHRDSARANERLRGLPK